MERDENGRFVKGNGGGPGRPAKSREERYMEIAVNTVTYSQWKNIIQKAAEQAERGNANARKWLADYLLGPPTQRIEQSNDGRLHVTVEYVTGDDTTS